MNRAISISGMKANAAVSLEICVLDAYWMFLLSPKCVLHRRSQIESERQEKLSLAMGCDTNDKLKKNNFFWIVIHTVFDCWGRVPGYLPDSLKPSFVILGCQLLHAALIFWFANKLSQFQLLNAWLLALFIYIKYPKENSYFLCLSIQIYKFI